MRWSKRPGVYIKNFYLAEQAYERKTESGRRTTGPQGNTARPRGGRALLPCDLLMGPLGCFLFLYFFLYSKTDRNNFYGIFGVGLLTVSRTSSFSGFWSILEGLSYVFLRCNCFNNISFNINGGT